MTTTDALFCSLTPLRLAELVRSARHAVCYAGPGLQLDLAQAMVEVAGRVGKEMLTVSLDFDDRVMRMGYGNVEAVKLLLDAGIAVQSSPGLRTALVVVDDAGYIFTHCAVPGGRAHRRRCIERRAHVGRTGGAGAGPAVTRCQDYCDSPGQDPRGQTAHRSLDRGCRIGTHHARKIGRSDHQP